MSTLDTNIRTKIAFARRLYVAASIPVPDDVDRAFNRFLLESEGTDESAAELLAVISLEDILTDVGSQFRPSILTHMHPTVAQAIAIERAAFDSISIFCRHEQRQANMCDCGRIMVLNRPDGQYTCSCGNSVATESANEVRQGEQAPKKNTRRHTPAVYLRETYNRITGTHDSNTVFPPRIIESVRGYLVRNNITLTNSPHYAYHLRNIMRILRYSCPGITKYDKFTTFVFALLYPEYPIPRLTQDQYNNVLRYFTAIVDLYSVANPGGYIKSYPYIFYKLVEILYPNEHELLKFIYIQSELTYMRNDKLFEPFFKAALPVGYRFNPTSDQIYTRARRRS
jgi:hypothetical protein